MKTLKSLFLLIFVISVSFISCNKDDNEDDKNTDQVETDLSDPIKFNGKQYAISLHRYCWLEAKEFAEEKGGYLVVINDEAENNFIKDNYRADLGGAMDILWLGASDIDEEGVFRWVNGEPFSYTNWCPGEPNNSTEDGIVFQNCLHMYADGTWDDIVEQTECYAIVEFDQ